MKTVKDMKPGETRTIKKVNGSGPIRKRVLDMGLTKSATVTIIRRAPLGDPIEIRVRGYDLSIRGSEAEIVEVE